MEDRSIQRRLAAVLAADVAGYTRLMEQDTDGTVAAWQAARDDVIDPTVTEYAGRVVKLTGDGFLVEFPAVQDAVNCAIKLQEGLASSSLKFRIGVNMGDIVDDGRDIHGEGVNIAARIEALADEGGISISGDVYNQVRHRIDANFEDRGEHTVKNISDPVRVFAIHLDNTEYDTPHPNVAVSNKPSIAVLPFDNLSGDPEQEYFSDGISEDIITALSRLRWLSVIARNSTFTYKNQAIDVQTVAKDLAVRYVLEGSVRKAGNRVRITAQLIEGETGNHIWAERFDRELEDIFAVQDEITETVAGSVQSELGLTEQKRAKSKPPENLDAWEAYQRGVALLKERTVESMIAARRQFEHSMALDPNFALSHVGYVQTVANVHFGAQKSADWEEIERVAKRAVELDPNESQAHATLGMWHRHNGDGPSALSELETALKLNPSDAYIRMEIGTEMVHCGRAADGVPYFHAAIRLSPRDADIGRFYSRLMQAYICLNDYESAVEYGRKAVQYPNAPWAHAFLASALALYGEMEESKRTLAEAIRRRPELTVAHFLDAPMVPYTPYKALMADGLRKAGLSEN